MGRARLDTSATVHLGSDEFVFGTRDLSVLGIALNGDRRAPEGSFLRLVLRLPGDRRPIDVDGVVVRTAVGSDSTTWGLRFHEPPRHVTEAIARFVAENRCDRPFADAAPRLHGIRLQAEGAGRETAPPEADAASDGQPARTLDERLEGLYKRAVRGPERDSKPGGFWHRGRQSGPRRGG